MTIESFIHTFSHHHHFRIGSSSIHHHPSDETITINKNKNKCSRKDRKKERKIERACDKSSRYISKAMWKEEVWKWTLGTTTTDWQRRRERRGERASFYIITYICFCTESNPKKFILVAAYKSAFVDDFTLTLEDRKMRLISRVSLIITPMPGW